MIGMRPITDQDICDTLSGYEEKTIFYRKKIIELESSLRNVSATQQDLIYTASVPGKRETEIFAKANGHRDLADVLQRYQELERDHLASVATNIRYFTDELEVMNRIMVCYSILPPQYHTVLQLLYRNCMAPEKVAEELNVSRKTIFDWRKKALIGIRENYQKPISTKEFRY